MRKIVILLAAVCFAASSVVASEAEKAQVVSAVHAPLWKSFPLNDVKLTDSYFKETMDHHSEYILSLEIDRLIPHVRRQAGLEPKGKNYF